MRDDPLKPRGEDTAQAVREWAQDETKAGPAARFELGKFFFGVSTGSAGVLVTLLGLDESLAFGVKDLAAFALLLLSALVALFMVIPSVWPLQGDSDLFALHDRALRRVVRSTWAWFVSWLLGATLAVWAILGR